MGSQVKLSSCFASTLACAALGLLAVASPASAIFSQTLYGSASGSGSSCTASDPCSLSTALSAAEAGTGSQLVYVASGTYAASNGYTIPSSSSAGLIDIEAQPGDATAPVLSGNNANTVITVQTGSAIDLGLNGLTIENGEKNITTNVLNYGAGIDAGGTGSLSINDCTIADNTITSSIGMAEGAGIYSGGPLAISDSSIDNNSETATDFSEAQSIVYAQDGFTVTDSTFAYNTTSATGTQAFGILSNGIDGSASVVGSSFIDNTVTSTGSNNNVYGGAIGGSGTGLTVADSTFVGNTASGGNGFGGAIAGTGSPLTVTASTFYGNSADYGGAIANGALYGSITDSTFVDNSGNGSTIVSFNSGDALLGGDLLVGHAGHECGVAGLVDGGYDVSDDATCAFTATGSIENWTGAGTLSTLGWNGGPAETVVPSTASGLTVVPSGTTVSHTIDSEPVTETLCSDPIPTFPDERGLSRPYGANTDCTVGATEAVPLIPGLWSADTASFQVGVASSTPLHETDAPSGVTPAYSTITTPPQGLTLVDNGNGTAAIAGTPVAGTAGTYTVMVQATNSGYLPNIEPVTITIQPAPENSPAPTPTPTSPPTPTPTPASTKISGPVAGEIYFGSVPAAVCASGCTITKRTSKAPNGTLVKVTATAAGSVTSTLQYTVASATLPFRPAAGQLYATGRGRSYTLVIVSKTKPKLVDAVLSPKRPHAAGGSFRSDGKVGGTARWKAGVRLALVKRKPAKWHVGILIGKKLDVLTLVS